MKKSNKLVALTVALMLLFSASTAFSATYVSDPVSPSIANPGDGEAQPGMPDEALPTEDPDAGPETEELEAVVQTEDEGGTVNIRAAASADAEIIGRLSRNDRVVVLGTEGDWINIRANDIVGYVYSKYLSIAEKPAAPEDSAGAEQSAPAQFESQYLRNEQGELILDEQGNPIPLAPREGALYQRDAEGNLILDENGEPILIEVPIAQDEENRSDLSQAVIRTWMDANDGTRFGDTVTIYYEIENFYGWPYSVQWQRKGADGWVDVPGANGKTHSFTLTEDNLNTEWRVRVDVVVPEVS